MNGGMHHVVEAIIHQAVPINPVLPLEPGGNNMQTVMSAARGCASMAGMLGGVIDKLILDRCQRFCQACPYHFFTRRHDESFIYFERKRLCATTNANIK